MAGVMAPSELAAATWTVDALFASGLCDSVPGHFQCQTIQAAVTAAGAGDTVNVNAGTYDEDVTVSTSLSLLGAGAGSTTIRGVIGGPSSSTVRVNAGNVTIAGFTITRLGNTVAEWDLALNMAGISIQSVPPGAVIRDNVLTHNRTGIDVNNSSGHTIRNNVITDNRTGMILRNVTDDLTVVENEITNNWTLGVLFLDASGGTNVPPQSALGSTFRNNALSGSWYGQIVDRQAGVSLPAPGSTNLKSFSGNWLGTTSPVFSAANSTEPGYSALIPVEFGGTAVPPGGQPDILGAASANVDFTPFLDSGTDSNLETAGGRGTAGFQGDPSSLWVTATGAQTGVTGRIQEGIDLVSGSSMTINVVAGTYTGSPDVTGKSITLAPGAGPAQVTITGDLLLTGGTTLAMKLNGATPGSGHDQLVINGSGAVDLAGATLRLSLGFTPVPGTAFTIVDDDLADPVAGTFAGLAEGATLSVSGRDLAISYVGGTGNDVTLTDLGPTPVPTTTTLTAVPNPASPGAQVTLTATVAPSPGTVGTVQFLDGGVAIGGCPAVPLAGGVASCTTPPVTQGTHTLTAVYSGGGAFLGSTSSAVTLAVGEAAVPALNGAGLAILIGLVAAAGALSLASRSFS
jgi:parallel beta-helix repeat protein